MEKLQVDGERGHLLSLQEFPEFTQTSVLFLFLGATMERWYLQRQDCALLPCRSPGGVVVSLSKRYCSVDTSIS